MGSKLTEIIKEKYTSARETFDKIKNDLRFRLQWAKEFAPDYLPKFNSVKNVVTNSSALLLPVAFGYSANGGLENDMQKIANDKMIPAIEVSAAQPLNNATYVPTSNDLDKMVGNYDGDKEDCGCMGVSNVRAKTSSMGKVKSFAAGVATEDAQGHNWHLSLEPNKTYKLTDLFDINFNNIDGRVVEVYEAKGYTIDKNNLAIITGPNPEKLDVYFGFDSKSPDCMEGIRFLLDKPYSSNNNHQSSQTDSTTINVYVDCDACNNDGIDDILQKKAEWEAAKANGKAKQAEYQSKIDIIGNAIGDDCNSPKNPFKLNEGTTGLYVSTTQSFLGESHTMFGIRTQPWGANSSGPRFTAAYITNSGLVEINERIERSTLGSGETHSYTVLGEGDLHGLHLELSGVLASKKNGKFAGMGVDLGGYLNILVPKSDSWMQINNSTSQNGYVNITEGLPFQLNEILIQYGPSVGVNLNLGQGLINVSGRFVVDMNKYFGGNKIKSAGNGNPSLADQNNPIKFEQFGAYNPSRLEVAVTLNFDGLYQRTTHK